MMTRVVSGIVDDKIGKAFLNFKSDIERIYILIEQTSGPNFKEAENIAHKKHLEWKAERDKQIKENEYFKKHGLPLQDDN